MKDGVNATPLPTVNTNGYIDHAACLDMMNAEANTILRFFFSSRRRHTRLVSDWSSDVCSSDLPLPASHSPNMLTSKEKSDTRRLPMMPIRDVVIFPHMMTPFVVGRESSVRALEEALAEDKKIFLATQHDASVDEPRPDEIFSVGTVANIV